MAEEHLIAIKQTTFASPTAFTSAKAYPVRSGSGVMGQEYIDERLTGSGRALARTYQGAKSPSGSIEMLLFPDLMGIFFAAAGMVCTTSTPGGATNARDNNFLLGTGAATYLTMQYKYDSSIAVNYRSVFIDKITLNVTPNQAAVLTIDWLADDEALAGGTYQDTSSSAAVVATPTYISSALVPYIYHNAVINLGGTPALDGTTKEITLDTPTAVTNFESFELTITNNAEHKHHLNGKRTAGRIAKRDFDVEVSFEVDHDTLANTYYNYVRNGTKPAVQIALTGAIIEDTTPYEFIATVPAVRFDEADFADIMGSQDDRVQSVSGIGIEDTVTGEVIGIHIMDTQTSY